MANDEGKYHGTVEYYLVYSEMVSAARYQGLTTYQEIAQIMGLPLSGSYMGSEVGNIIGEISANELQHGRPMLSAVCVGVPSKAYIFPKTWFYA